MDRVSVSAEYKNCVLGLLCYDEDSRLSLEELDRNPWLSNFKGEEYD